MVRNHSLWQTCTTIILLYANMKLSLAGSYVFLLLGKSYFHFTNWRTRKNMKLTIILLCFFNSVSFVAAGSMPSVALWQMGSFQTDTYVLYVWIHLEWESHVNTSTIKTGSEMVCRCCGCTIDCDGLLCDLNHCFVTHRDEAQALHSSILELISNQVG